MSEPIKPRIDFAEPLQADREEQFKRAQAFSERKRSCSRRR
ncbi:Uncharacterised protein [Atlantibacter hermannii]|nr:Uncharacterised protein [Atlantibacter hermannii]